MRFRGTDTSGSSDRFFFLLHSVLMDVTVFGWFHIVPFFYLRLKQVLRPFLKGISLYVMSVTFQTLSSLFDVHSKFLVLQRTGEYQDVLPKVYVTGRARWTKRAFLLLMELRFILERLVFTRPRRLCVVCSLWSCCNRQACHSCYIKLFNSLMSFLLVDLRTKHRSSSRALVRYFRC